MTRSVRWAVALLVLSAACTSGADTTSESTGEIGPGRLVFLDESGDVVVIDPDGANRIALTDNAGESALYSQPIWSPDAESIAWGQVTADGFAVGIQTVGEDSPSTIPTANLPIYLYWSPDSSNLALLHPGSEGLDFEVVDVPGRTASVLDRGAPFYFSWSPDSEEVATHVGPDRFESIKPNGSRRRLGTTAAGYLAPQWTDAGIFHVDEEGLVLDDQDGERRVVAEVGEFTFFVVNPQGTKVALQSVGDNPAVSVSFVEVAAIPGDVVVVVDVATGETDVVTTEPALAFFWSPNGESLLVMTPTGEGMQASVWGGNEESVTYAEFRPSILLIREMYPFFTQYAQSLSYWSPDSTAFTYASDEGIWIQELDGSGPTLVSTGSWVAWSS